MSVLSLDALYSSSLVIHVLVEIRSLKVMGEYSHCLILIVVINLSNTISHFIVCAIYMKFIIKTCVMVFYGQYSWSEKG